MQQLLRHVQVTPGINDVGFDPYEHPDPGQLAQSVLPVEVLEVVQFGSVRARRPMIRNGKILQATLLCCNNYFLKRGERMSGENGMDVEVPKHLWAHVRFPPLSLSKDETIMLPKETVSYTHLRAHETRHDLVC